MYFKILIVLSILALSDAKFSEIASFFGKLFGIEKCPKIPDPVSTDETYCGEQPKKCDPSYKYRAIDGSCNNLKHPWWGTPYTPYKRLLENTYSDGVSKFPKTINNQDLPNARALSENVFPIKHKDDVLWTLSFMQYGQIIAHDISLTADVGQTGIFVACCLEGKLQDVAKTDPRCTPIYIPKSDQFYTKYNLTCINFYRTQTTHDRKDCKSTTKIAEPLTSVTGFIDASYIYGSNKTECDKVRAFKDGLLKFELKNGIEYPPQVPNPTEICYIKTAKQPCYLAGDIRVNQNTQLTVLQIVYLIHHNFVARNLAKLNPHWDDEKIFQETRKIVIAVHQHIFYTEMLVFLLGSSILVHHKVVYPGVSGFINDYDPTVNPSSTLEFSTVGFRLFHSEIQTILNGYDEDRSVNNTIDMTDWMFKPEIIEKNDNIQQLCRGLTTQPQSAVDNYYTSGPKQSMFKSGIIDDSYEAKRRHMKSAHSSAGDDLRAIDIMRGRDHGLATYGQFVVKCCLGKLETWKDAEKFFPIESLEKLKTFYSDPKYIELSVGVYLEKRLPVALSGPVAACIIADQFYRSRVGDRFFYQNEGVFTKGQLGEIMHTTFGDLMCLLKGIKQMQPKAFQQISFLNPLLSCDSRQSFDFTQWKDNNH